MFLPFNGVEMMKTYTDYESIPKHAAYLGSEDTAGYMSEAVNDAIDRAIEPVCLRDDDGTRHYFDVA